MTKLSILYVCTENICRSPLAEGLMLKVISDYGLKRHFKIDSAGTHASQVGHKPDIRAVNVAREIGVKLRGKARRITQGDFEKYDYVVAMDKSNYESLKEICPDELAYRLNLLMDFAPELDLSEVPDPYYGPITGFKYVFELIEQANLGLLAQLQGRLS